jgi:hypothetical protein
MGARIFEDVLPAGHVTRPALAAGGLSQRCRKVQKFVAELRKGCDLGKQSANPLSASMNGRLPCP